MAHHHHCSSIDSRFLSCHRARRASSSTHPPNHQASGWDCCCVVVVVFVRLSGAIGHRLRLRTPAMNQLMQWCASRFTAASNSFWQSQESGLEVRSFLLSFLKAMSSCYYCSFMILLVTLIVWNGPPSKAGLPEAWMAVQDGGQDVVRVALLQCLNLSRKPHVLHGSLWFLKLFIFQRWNFMPRSTNKVT